MRRQHRLQRRVDGMRGDVAGVDARAAGEGLHVQAGRHPRPIVDRIVVPQERLSPQRLCDAVEVARAELARAGLLPCPEHVDVRVQPPAERLQVTGRAGAEVAVEVGLVAVVGRAEHEPPSLAVLGDEVDDPDLGFGQVGQVATHVVEQHAQNLDPDIVQPGELFAQRAASASGVTSR